jgi:excisionase family DNA binding protein
MPIENNGPDAEFWTKKQVADFLHVSSRTVENMMFRHQLPFFRLNKRLVRFRREDILEHLQRNYRVNAMECFASPGAGNP